MFQSAFPDFTSAVPMPHEAFPPDRTIADILLFGNCLFSFAFPFKKKSVRSEAQAVKRRFSLSAVASNNEVGHMSLCFSAATTAPILF